MDCRAEGCGLPAVADRPTCSWHRRHGVDSSRPMRPDEVIAQTEATVASGLADSVEWAAADVGLAVASFARVLQRAGRHDLWAALQAEPVGAGARRGKLMFR